MVARARLKKNPLKNYIIIFIFFKDTLKDTILLIRQKRKFFEFK